MPRGVKRKKSGRVGRPSHLASASTIELKRELERRQGMVQELARQRDALIAEVQELESIFGSSAGSGISNGRRTRWTSGRARRGRPALNQTGPRRGRRGRGPNAKSLVSTLQSTLAGTTMAVSDITEAVRKAGYHSKSANFRNIVNQALLTNPDVFKKVARGQYTAR